MHQSVRFWGFQRFRCTTGNNYLSTFNAERIVLITGHDECCLVLNQTPLFMFVKPLAVLLSNMLVVLVYFGVVGPYGETSAKRVKKGKRREVCSLPLRLSAR